METKTLAKPSLLPSTSAGLHAKTSPLQNVPVEDTPQELERKRIMYKNIFTLPKGTDHFKYFEKVPHPEKYGPELLGIYESSPKVDLNPDLAMKKMEFERVKRELAGKLSETDIRIMRLPERLEEKIAETWDKEYIAADDHLCRSFYNYFTTPADKNFFPDIQWIDYNFATNYRPARVALRDLKANLLNTKAIKKLTEKLEDAGAFGTEKKDFYFWHSNPYDWSELSYQARSVEFSYLWDSIVTVVNFDLPPQYCALGDFTLNALPEGYVQPLGNGDYEICVSKVYIFVNDMFNFENWSYLGSWDLNERYENYGQPFPYFMTELFNSNFTSFQKLGYGQSFPVLSRLHEIEDFSPQCLRYSHVK